MISISSLRFILPVLLLSALTFAALASSGSSRPGHQVAATGSPVFTQSGAALFSVLMPVAPPPALLGTFETSVMPPSYSPGTMCSTETDFSYCSALGTGDVCSAQHQHAMFCSTFPNVLTGSGDGAICSAGPTDSTCSVLPPRSTQPGSGWCSARGWDGITQSCSATSSIGENQRCSTKGPASFDTCSVVAAGHSGYAECSVLNIGATTNSFCSTKAGMPIASKACSAVGNGNWCSIKIGAKGRCTTFGSALAGSCSVQSAGAGCSIIPISTSDPCAM